MGKVALIIGGGKIGRGFLAQLLQEEGWEIRFTDYSKPLIENLNKNNNFTSHILGMEENSTVVKNYEAFHLTDELKFREAWEESDLIFTAVGGKNLVSIAPYIAKTFVNSINSNTKNIILCENWKNPVETLKNEIINSLGLDDSLRFKKNVGITEAVIMRVSVDPPADISNTNNLDTWGNNYWELPINRENFIGEPPNFKYIKFISNFSNFLERKMYTNNTSNAVISYLGYHKGYEYTADAANDKSISMILDKLYDNLNQMIIKEYNVDILDQENFSQQARDKYSDKTIVDSLYRHAADPIRKIGYNDRLIQPALLMLKHKINPKIIVKTIVAAIYYDYSEDENAIKLKKIREDNGIPYILKNICELKESSVLYSLIIEEAQKWQGVPEYE